MSEYEEINELDDWIAQHTNWPDEHELRQPVNTYPKASWVQVERHVYEAMECVVSFHHEKIARQAGCESVAEFQSLEPHLNVIEAWMQRRPKHWTEFTASDTVIYCIGLVVFVVLSWLIILTG